MVPGAASATARTASPAAAAARAAGRAPLPSDSSSELGSFSAAGSSFGRWRSPSLGAAAEARGSARARSRIPQQNGSIVVSHLWSPVARTSAGGRARERASKLRAYLGDVFHTCVDLPWRKVVPLVVAAYVCSWLLYGSLGKLIWGRSCLHGNEDGSFMGWYFWVCETMSTVGFGHLAPTCDGTKVLVSLMTLHGVFMNAVVFGFVFTKFASPARRGRMILFSETACGELVRAEDGGQVLGLSVRLVNARRHAVLSPAAEFFLVDHRPLAAGGVPVFIEAAFRQSHPLAFLEMPCVLTAMFHPGSLAYSAALPSLTDDVSPGPMGSSLDDPATGDPLLISPPLQYLSLVLIFSARDASSGSDFEVRKWWHLANVHWGRSFAPMLIPKAAPQQLPIRGGSGHGDEAVNDEERAGAPPPPLLPHLAAEEGEGGGLYEGVTLDLTRLSMTVPVVVGDLGTD